MSLGRRDFLQTLALAAAGGFALDAPGVLALQPDAARRFYELPHFGNVSILHFTDCHAQLLPLHFREPSVNIGAGSAAGQPPHLVGARLLKAFGIRAGSRDAHAFTHLDFEAAARTYGRVGGFAHLATLVERLRASRPGALLLDGGDTWQGSATALWTEGQDMVDACRLLGVDMMASHWEHTLGSARVMELVAQMGGRTAFLAHNVRTADFGDSVFEPFALREVGGVPIAVIGQAFPYTKVAHPARFAADWTFGLDEENLQATVDAARRQGAAAVLLLSHNGMDVDCKLASRVTGIDAILGGHTHDALPAPRIVANRSGQTLVTNAGCHGKFLGVLDLDVRGGRGGGVKGYRYKLLPVFANLLPADVRMQAQIERSRAPFAARLDQTLARNSGLLYRRGNFNGTWDQLIVDALMEVKGAEIAFSPGFRWGPTLLPGEPITRGALMDQLAITYPATTLADLTGARIKAVLEDVADNLFNPDPYRQQGGDMVRTGGLTYAIAPAAPIGARISELRLRGWPLDADKTYRVAGWASVADDATGGAPIWDVVEAWLRDRRVVAPFAPNVPALVGVPGGG